MGQSQSHPMRTLHDSILDITSDRFRSCEVEIVGITYLHIMLLIIEAYKHREID